MAIVWESHWKTWEKFSIEFFVIPAHLKKLKIEIDFKTVAWKFVGYKQGADAF